jgi:hypothetical protein
MNLTEVGDQSDKPLVEYCRQRLLAFQTRPRISSFLVSVAPAVGRILADRKLLMA